MKDADTSSTDQPLTLDERRAFMKLPLAERRRRMAEQADNMAVEYEGADETGERRDWQGGDFVDV